MASAGAVAIRMGSGETAARASGEAQDGIDGNVPATNPYTGARERDALRVVGFPLFPGATLLDFAGATQIFKFAGMVPVWLAARRGPGETTEGVSVLPTHTFDNHPHIDVIFVPGGGAPGVVAAMFDPPMQGFLRDAAGEASWVGSVCTGAFILAATGLLDGCRATTYWSQIPNLRLLREKLKIEVPEGFPRFVIDADKKRFTGGGVSSSMDLALELASTIAGRATAEAAQLSVQYAPASSIHAGDPSQAPEPLTTRLREAQEGGLTVPVKRAVERLLAAK
jgi:cyclohexyl-isocyanide hydratase